MYHKFIGGGGIAAGSVLPVTGGPGNILWLGMAAFVLVMAGVAVATIVPRRRRNTRKVNPAGVR